MSENQYQKAKREERIIDLIFGDLGDCRNSFFTLSKRVQPLNEMFAAESRNDF